MASGLDKSAKTRQADTSAECRSTFLNDIDPFLNTKAISQNKSRSAHATCLKTVMAVQQNQVSIFTLSKSW